MTYPLNVRRSCRTLLAVTCFGTSVALAQTTEDRTSMPSVCSERDVDAF